VAHLDDRGFLEELSQRLVTLVSKVEMEIHVLVHFVGDRPIQQNNTIGHRQLQNKVNERKSGTL
jgi:hypothetical protein